MIQIFQIYLFHRYFTSGVFESCKLIPDKATARFLERYSFILRTEPGKMGLYSSSKNFPCALLTYLQERLAGAPLQFLMMSNASEFTQITDVPFDYVGQISLSTRSSQGVPADTSGTLQQKLEPVLGGRQLNQSGVIGVLSVYLDDCLALGGQNICYQVDFQARVLHWLYYVINRSQSKLHQPIIRNQQQLFFDAPVPVVLSTGESALSFSSGVLQFPLQEDPETSFNLIDHLQPSLHASEQTIEHCLIKGLPTPSGECLKAKQVEGSLYAFGEMYVYL